MTLAEIVRVWLILVMHGFQLSSLSCDFPSSCPRSLPSPSMQHSSNRGGAPQQDEPIALGLPDVVQLSTNGHRTQTPPPYSFSTHTVSVRHREADLPALSPTLFIFYSTVRYTIGVEYQYEVRGGQAFTFTESASSLRKLYSNHGHGQVIYLTPTSSPFQRLLTACLPYCIVRATFKVWPARAP